jgi:hypothetical protein
MEHSPAEGVLQSLLMWPVMVARMRPVGEVGQARASRTLREVTLAVLAIRVYGHTVADRL